MNRTGVRLCPKDRQRAFTLLEMLAVMLLMVVALGVVANGIGHHLRNDTARQQAGVLMLALRGARNDAIISGRGQAVTFQLSAPGWQRPGKPAQVLPDELELKLTSAMQASGQPSIVFNPDGSSSGGHVLLQKNGHGWRVDVQWLTGLATLQELATR